MTVIPAIVPLAGKFCVNQVGDGLGVEAGLGEKRVSASTCFAGCAGISLTGGVTSTTQQEAIVNALMVERSDRMVLLADSRKLGISAGFGYAGLSHVNLLITDSDATDEDIAVLREAGVHEIRRV